jgi:gas vesicle protein
MKFALGFLIGLMIGAGVALMYAPTSGEETRANIKTQVDAQSAQIQEQWQARYQQLQARVDKMSGDMQALTKQSKEVEPTA